MVSVDALLELVNDLGKGDHTVVWLAKAIDPRGDTTKEWPHVEGRRITVHAPVATRVSSRAFATWSTRCVGWLDLVALELDAAERVGTDAFERCPSLERVSLPVVRTIYDAAFCDCTALTAVPAPATSATSPSATATPSPRCTPRRPATSGNGRFPLVGP